MFEADFGLHAAPFQLTPDPRYFFASRTHARALAYLKYGAAQGEGFVVVTGAVGSGKTTLVRTLIGELDAARVQAAHWAASRLDDVGILHAVCRAFGSVTEAGAHKVHLQGQLEATLAGLASTGRQALLIVDEAQNLGLDEIEELRLLANLQRGSRALLQTYLVGQPELRTRLGDPSLQALRQRVIASCHLAPLEPDETAAYVRHRLEHAGWSGSPSFDPAAWSAIHEASAGVPRRINLLCTRLLLACALDDAGGDGATRTISPQAVRTAAGELELEFAS